MKKNTETHKKYTALVNRISCGGNSQIVVIDHTTGKPIVWQRIVTKDSEAVPTLSPSLKNAIFQLCLDERECNILLCEDGNVVESSPPIEMRQYRYPASKQRRG